MHKLSLLMHSKSLALSLSPVKLIGILCFRGKIPARVKSLMRMIAANFTISQLLSHLIMLNTPLMHTKLVLTRKSTFLQSDDDLRQQ